MRMCIIKSIHDNFFATAKCSPFPHIFRIKFRNNLQLSLPLLKHINKWPGGLWVYPICGSLCKTECMFTENLNFCIVLFSAFDLHEVDQFLPLFCWIYWVGLEDVVWQMFGKLLLNYSDILFNTVLYVKSEAFFKTCF